MPRVPELFVAALGTWKSLAVFCPLFPAFGPEPIKTRMTLGKARVLVTTSALYARKVAPLRAELPELAAVLLIDAEAGAPPERGVYSLPELLARASADYTLPTTSEDDPALLHFTSGTTGTPKGAVHVHGAVLAHYITGRLALDLRAGDVFWCTADPGWVTGTSYGIIAPLAEGSRSVYAPEQRRIEVGLQLLERPIIRLTLDARRDHRDPAGPHGARGCLQEHSHHGGERVK